MTEQVPSVGRIVHLVLPSGSHEGEHRPAIITSVLSEPAQPDSACHLTVFSEWGDDVPDGGRVRYVHQGTSLGDWHWPEYVAPVDVSVTVVPVEPEAASPVPAGRAPESGPSVTDDRAPEQPVEVVPPAESGPVSDAPPVEPTAEPAPVQ